MFDAGKVTESIIEIRKIQEQYKSSRRSTLAAELGEVHPSDREAMQLKKRQEKSSEAIERMSELLELLSIRERRLLAQAEVAKKTVNPVKEKADLSKTEAAAGAGFEALKKKLETLNQEVDVRSAVEDCFQTVTLLQEHQFVCGEYFLVLSDGKGQVIELDNPPVVNDCLRTLRWCDGTRLQPIPIDKFLRSASRGRVLQLTDKRLCDASRTGASQEEAIVSDTAERVAYWIWAHFRSCWMLHNAVELFPAAVSSSKCAIASFGLANTTKLFR